MSTMHDAGITCDGIAGPQSTARTPFPRRRGQLGLIGAFGALAGCGGGASAPVGIFSTGVEATPVSPVLGDLPTPVDVSSTDSPEGAGLIVASNSSPAAWNAQLNAVGEASTTGVEMVPDDVAGGHASSGGRDGPATSPAALSEGVARKATGVAFDDHPFADAPEGPGAVELVATPYDDPGTVPPQGLLVPSHPTQNRAPQTLLARAPLDRTETIGELIDPIDLNGVFHDPDGDPLTIRVEFDRANSDLSFDAGGKLRITGESVGSDDVIVNFIVAPWIPQDAVGPNEVIVTPIVGSWIWGESSGSADVIVGAVEDEHMGIRPWELRLVLRRGNPADHG